VIVRRLILLIAAVGLAGPALAQADKAGAFIDRFASLNLGHWHVSHGWANGPHQNCTWMSSHVKVDGAVELSLTNEPTKDRPFTCAELQTKQFYGFGTYEVRMKTAAGPGLVTAFFTYTGPPHGRPHDEIDFEFLGKAPAEAFVSYFANGKTSPETAKLPFDSSTAAHDYAFEWLPDTIRWYAGGRLIREVKASDGKAIPTQTQKIYLSIWNGTGWDQEAWLGRFSYPGRPLKAMYEYVAFTPAGAPCHFPESIVCRQADRVK
jgi:endo-1,3-1,4-beta-glycanase ExoK